MTKLQESNMLNVRVTAKDGKTATYGFKANSPEEALAKAKEQYQKDHKGATDFEAKIIRFDESLIKDALMLSEDKELLAEAAHAVIKDLLAKFEKESGETTHFYVKAPGFKVWTRGDGSKYKDPGQIKGGYDDKLSAEQKKQVAAFWDFLQKQPSAKKIEVSGEFGSSEYKKAITLKGLYFAMTSWGAVEYGDASRLRNSSVWRKKDVKEAWTPTPAQRKEIADGWAKKHPNIDAEIAAAEKEQIPHYEMSSGSHYYKGKAAADKLAQLKSIKKIIDDGKDIKEGSETVDDIDKKIEFHKRGQAAAQYKGSMNKMHAEKIRELEAKKQALKQNVEEGLGDTIKRGIKSVKRGMQGWDKDAVGPGGEKLGDPKDIVKRNKAYSDEEVVSLAKEKKLGFPFGDDKNAGPHSPRGLQKRVLDREMKKRGLDVQEGLLPGQGKWKKEMQEKGAVRFWRDTHGGGAVDRIVAYDEDDKVVGSFNCKGLKEDYSDLASWKNDAKKAGLKIEKSQSADWSYEASDGKKVVGKFVSTNVKQNSHGYLKVSLKENFSTIREMIKMIPRGRLDEASVLHKALDRALSKEKKASPVQVEKNKERWAKIQQGAKAVGKFLTQPDPAIKKQKAAMDTIDDLEAKAATLKRFKSSKPIEESVTKFKGYDVHHMPNGIMVEVWGDDNSMEDEDYNAHYGISVVFGKPGKQPHLVTSDRLADQQAAKYKSAIIAAAEKRLNKEDRDYLASL